jgi:hypothetical protein
MHLSVVDQPEAHARSSDTTPCRTGVRIGAIAMQKTQVCLSAVQQPRIHTRSLDSTV